MALSLKFGIVTDIQQNAKYTGISNRVTGKSLILDAACMLKHLLLATSFISDDQVLNPFLNYFASFGMLFGAFNVLNSFKKV